MACTNCGNIGRAGKKCARCGAKVPFPTPTRIGDADDLGGFLALPAGGEVKALRNHVAIRAAALSNIFAQIEGRFKRYFQDQQTETLRSLRNTIGNPNTDALWDADAAQEGARSILRVGIALAGQAAYKSAVDDYGLRVAWRDDHPFIDQHLGSRLHLIQNIDNTTRTAIKGTLSEGVKVGETIPQLSKRVTTVYDDAKTVRAKKIARTEVMQAHAKASLTAYKEAAVEKAEMYDGDEDEDCSAIDGEIVSMDEADSLMDDEHPNGTRGVAPYFGKRNDV
jgi:SPP1 gp7 family putative phage head morphogenesis protein